MTDGEHDVCRALPLTFLGVQESSRWAEQYRRFRTLTNKKYALQRVSTMSGEGQFSRVCRENRNSPHLWTERSTCGCKRNDSGAYNDDKMSTYGHLQDGAFVLFLLEVR